MQTCVHMSSHVSQFTCLTYTVTCMVLRKRLCFCVLYCTVLYSIQSYSSLISSPGCLEASIKAALMWPVLLPAPGCQLLHCTIMLFKVLYCKIKNVLIFVYELYEKYYNTTVPSIHNQLCQLGTWANSVGCMNKLDLRT